MKKRILATILALCMLTVSVPSVYAVEIADSGQCGDNVYWELNDEGTLTISGQGDMWNWSAGTFPPWGDYNNVDGFVQIDMSRVKHVEISDGVTSIGEYAFGQCINLTDIVISKTVINIQSDVFSCCYSLKSIDIASDNPNYSSTDGILFDKDKTELIQYPTGNTRNKYTVPNSVVSIREGAFSHCVSLTDITLSNGLTTINRDTFYGCENLENVIMQSGITSICTAAFSFCTNLKNIIIPNTVTDIQSGAFKNCSKLTEITIPESVTSIGDFAFVGAGLTYIDVNEKNKKYCSEDGVLFNKDKTELIQYPVGNNRKIYKIPTGVINISCNAFDYGTNLISVIIPNGVVSIGTYSHCENLTDISIPDGVVEIADWAFSNCINLKNITIPNSITDIGYQAFSNCKTLRSIKIPNGITNIGYGTFSGWNGLVDITIPNNVKFIDNFAFDGCKNLKSITIPDGVTIIGYQSFRGCDNLTDIYYNGTNERWRNISYNTGVPSKVKIHYSSGKTFTPANINPAKPNSGSSEYAYGSSVGNKTTDVRERLKNSADRFNKSALEYAAAVSSSSKKQVGTADDIETLANKLEKENRILFTTSPDSKTKKVAYIGYAKYLNQMIEEGIKEEGIKLNKINLSENSVMIDYQITSQILSKLRGKNLSYDYNGYTIKINSLAISKSYFGTLDVHTPDGRKISATIASDTNKTMADLQDFANQLTDVAKDENKKALKMVISDLVNLTGLGELGAMIARDSLKSYKPLKKLGYGDVAKNIKKCYSGYEAVKGILNCTQVSSLDSIIDNPKQLVKKINNLCEYESDIENAVVNAAQDKLVDSLYNLLYATQDYEDVRNGEQPTFKESIKNFFDKTTSWISSIFQCPVDFTVYDENGEMIGYVDDGAVYYNDDIYIEISGDVKTLYVPVGMKVDIKMTGTDEGEFNYIVEESIYNQPTGRLNYYGLPLSKGVEYTQSLDTTKFDNSTDVLPITSQDGDVLPNEYISSEDTTAYVIINADADNGGTVSGGGEYAKGDSVELSAVAINSNYEFNGWYVGDELVSVNNIYRFTAIENTDVHAEFIRVYNEDNAYEMTIPDACDLYTYIYKDDDASKGIVIAPFTDEPAENMKIYVTTYATDCSVLNNDIPCSATLNENNIYVFENIDFENAEKVVIKDKNNAEIASADYDSSKDITNIEIKVSDKYYDSLIVTAHKELDNIVVNFEILDNTINKNDIVAYLTEYGEKERFLGCTILNGTTTENRIVFGANLSDNRKLMFWDNNMCPITNVVTIDLFE